MELDPHCCRYAEQRKCLDACLGALWSGRSFVSLGFILWPLDMETSEWKHVKRRQFVGGIFIEGDRGFTLIEGFQIL